MHTPNIRRRTVRAGMLLITATLLLFDVLVFSALRAGLELSLDEVLEHRLEIAASEVSERPLEEAAERLVGLGVPATLRDVEGRAVTADPIAPRGGATPPVPGLVPPIESHSTTLEDGTTVEVFASRAGVERTSNRLLIIIVLGTAAALGLAYWLLRRLVNQTMEPLGHVAVTAEQIADGDRRERLRPDQPETELGRMATAFDEMLDALEGAIDEAEDERERNRRFLADAAHQLRTPVAGIRSAVELLLRETAPEAKDRLLAHTVRETARIGRLLNDLLHVARLDQGQPPVPMPTDLVALCREEVERARDLAPRLEVELSVPDDDLPDLQLDQGALSEAVANILDNARRHAEQQIEVLIERRDGHAVVRVEDDGPGVPEGAENLIFDRFASLDGAGGSGLGLPIGRGVARAHGGDLVYADEAFELHLPLSRAARDSGPLSGTS